MALDDYARLEAFTFIFGKREHQNEHDLVFSPIYFDDLHVSVQGVVENIRFHGKTIIGMAYAKTVKNLQQIFHGMRLWIIFLKETILWIYLI